MSNIEYTKTEPDILAELIECTKTQKFQRQRNSLPNLIRECFDRFDNYSSSYAFQTPEGDLVFDLVYEHGGGEGQGDSVERVYKVTLAGTELFTFRETGFYDSYNGIEWNDEYELVVPVQKMITVYETQK